MASFKTLPGFREFYPEECAVRNGIFAVWRRTAESFGFREFDPPVLEQLDLFTEKSGEEIKSQLFEFVDKGGRAVALRPEMTPSLARMAGAKAAGLKKPVKWFAIGENYRYERQQKGRLRAFYQYNADILGDDTVASDAEVIALMVESLRGFGLTENEFKVRLGDRKLWSLFLENLGVPETNLVAVLSVIDKFEKVPRQAILEMASDALSGSGIDAETLVGNVEKFIATSSVESLKSFFENAATSQTAEVAAARIDEWRALFAALENLGCAQFVKCDMGIVRGLAYYTGFVFEAFQTVGTGRALAGGGRYDSLASKLGYADMPAVGFGMGDVTVSDLLELVGKMPQADLGLDAYVVVGSPATRPAAMKIVAILRRAGLKTDYSFRDQGFGKQFKQADSLGAEFAVIVGDDEVAKNCAKVKNLKTAQETSVPVPEIADFLNSAK